MAEKTPNEKAADALRAKAEQYANYDSARLSKTEELGQANFAVLIDDFKDMQAFAKRVASCSWKGVPTDVLNDCFRGFEQLNDPTQRIQSFSILQNMNVAGEREARIQNFRTAWRALYQNVGQHLVYAETVDNGATQYKQVMVDAMAQADAAKSKFEADLAKTKTLVEQVESMAVKSGVTEQAVHFKTLADNYRIGAILWCVASLAFGIFLFWYVYNLHGITTDKTGQMISELMPRLIAVTLLSTALIFCIRNFSAMMHNVIVNRHRQTALTTFKTFVNGTEDPATKNSVLVQSTQAIFTPQPSGYLKADTEMPQMNQITEIVRGISKKE